MCEAKPIDNCIFCSSNLLKESVVDSDIWTYICSICGKVKIFYPDLSNIKKEYQEKLWLLSAFCRKQFNSGYEPVLITSDNADDIIGNLKNPKTLLEAQHKVLEYFGNKSDLKGSWIKIDENNYDWLDCLIESGKEMSYVMLTLFEQGYLQLKGKSIDRLFDELIELKSEYPRFISGQSDLIVEFDFRLTPKGREKLDELKSKRLYSDKVFIAMWFSNKTKNLRKSLISGITAAGYDPIIADEEYYTGDIMDFVTAGIRESKFVVADFTVDPEMIIKNNVLMEKGDSKVKGGVRGGVYYETGFARGLGLEVIHTCRDDSDSKQRLHFDIKQINTLFWKDEDVKTAKVRTLKQRQKESAPQNLSEKLYDRIVAIFGHGPLREKYLKCIAL